jgi:hypothetical protein
MRKVYYTGPQIPVIVLIFLILSSALSRSVRAQESPPPACTWAMQEIAAGHLAPSDLAEIPKTVTCFWELAPQLRNNVIHVALRAQAHLQKVSPAVQPGASSTTSNGTTSAISKPITPLASLASEYGGITSSTTNQTMTLQTTLDGIPSALVGHGIEPYCWSPVVVIPNCFGQKDLQVLNRFGFGVTANTSTSSQNVTGTASPAQGTSQQASLQNASNRAPSFSSAFTKIVLFRGKYTLPDKPPDGKATAEAQESLISAFRPPNLEPDVSNNYKSWKACIERQLTKDNLYKTSAANSYFNKYYKQIVGILFNGDAVDCSPSAPEVSSLPDPGKLAGETAQKTLISAVEKYMASASIFEAQLDKVLLGANAPALSFEYDFNKPVNQPTTSTLKLIGSKSFGPRICKKKPGALSDAASTQKAAENQRFTGTLNVAGDFYNATPSGVPGAGAFRALQAGTEFDVAFCTSTVNWIGSFLGNSTLGLTYYYQDQVSPSILKVTPGAPLSGISITGLDPSTSKVFAKKGPINFVQLKYGLGVGKNVKFPIAISWSNRTDLITHSLWSAQFGVSYDFSSLFGSN